MRTIVLLFALTLSCLAQPLSPNDPAFLQSTSPLRRGLLGYWRLEEASGTRYDCSQYGNHLTDNNSCGNTTGVQGNAVSLVASSSQYLSGPTNALVLNSFNAWTCAVWSKLSATNVFQFVVNRDNNADRREWTLLWTPAAFCYAASIGDGASGKTSVYAPSSLQGTNWNFICFGISNNVAWIETNGGSRYTTNLTITPGVSTNEFLVGKDGSFYYDGRSDELGIWNRVLTITETQQLYNTGRGTHFPWAHP